MAQVARLAQTWTKYLEVCITATAQLGRHHNFPHHHVGEDQSKGLTILLIRSGREGIGRAGIKFMAHELRLAPSPHRLLTYLLHSLGMWKQEESLTALSHTTLLYLASYILNLHSPGPLLTYVLHSMEKFSQEHLPHPPRRPLLISYILHCKLDLNDT